MSWAPLFLRRIREEGQTEGALSAWRPDILAALTLRCALSTAPSHQVEQSLETFTDAVRLENLHAAAMQSATLADFLAILADQGDLRG